MEPRRSMRPSLTPLPVVLLVALIGFHGYHVVANEDDPQRGGAFAMFATIDIGATRKIVATADDGDIDLVLPRSFDDRSAALRDRPTEEAARDLASSLRDLDWSVDEEGRATVADGGARLGPVRVQVVGFDAHGRLLSRYVLVDESSEPTP